MTTYADSLAKQIAKDLRHHYNWGFKEALHCEEVQALREALVLMLTINEDSVHFTSCARRVEAFDKLAKGEM